MGKKGSWFAAIKRIFVHHSKEKQVNYEHESKNTKETKKKGRGGLRYGETKSFIPIFREPSSIEKILGEVDDQNLFSRPPTPFGPPRTPQLLTPRATSPRKATSTRVTSPRKAISTRVTSPRKATSSRVTSPRKATSTRVTSPRASSIRVTSPRASSQRVASPSVPSSRDINRHKEIMRYVVEPTIQYRHLSATKIQTAYRGYMARRSFRALRGLVRLQGVVRGQNVRRQTANTLKMMQQLVRIQTQVRIQRIHILENQTRQSQAYKFNDEQESTLGKWDGSQFEAGNQGDWDYSTLTKEERETRTQKKIEAALKRERTMAYAYSNQSWKSNPKSAQASVPNVRPDGFPLWNWLEHEKPAKNNPPETRSRTFNLTPPRRTPEPKPSPRAPSTYKPQRHMVYDNFEVTTPTSTRSMAPLRSKHFMPTPTRKTPTMKFPKKDDDSLMSYPPYSVPNYMTPTASAKARANSNPKERFPGNDTKRRFSFPLTPMIGSFKWNKGSSTNKDLNMKKELENEQSFRSGGDFSVDSATSMPAAVGRKPFNRFV